MQLQRMFAWESYILQCKPSIHFSLDNLQPLKTSPQHVFLPISIQFMEVVSNSSPSKTPNFMSAQYK